ncbi:hypothetical protein F4820DRAFT_431637 [Hypoxylon rubiginosum]|uniref:Uncharacterized protein n=1 Tax=Hypoxylon rubiginosum TaxID=110542 RepID=A0ACB9YSG3_9PEZI|nr:hypothetical protein F4820DRAFT_431637 [Hypoxylon rubiginosum]
MSSFQSTGNAPAQRIPAWKRLGLKLKAAPDEQSQNATLYPSTAAPLVPNHRRENPAGPIDTNAKRKSSGVPALDRSAKRAKTDAPQNQTTPIRTPKKAKSVSFAVDSTQGAGSPAAANGTQPSTKRKQPSTKKSVPAPAKPLKKQAPVNLEPALAYLRQWHTSKDTWKFNKNHQTRLLEQVFADETTIPAADIHVFYEYIRGLKGAVRSRLRELASGTKALDMEQGPEGFPASGKEMAERKQREYQEVIAAFLGQPRTPGKRRFEEIDYVLRTADMEMQRRVVKRMRCEMVLDELSDSETETASTTTATTTSTENENSAAGDLEDGANGVATDGGEDTLRLRLNDGPQQRLKRKRKVRTAVVDEESSSESDSSSSSGGESDSDAGSSSSSDESDDEVVQPQLLANEVDSSSSSSSSSEDSDSDEDDD